MRGQYQALIPLCAAAIEICIPILIMVFVFLTPDGSISASFSDIDGLRVPSDFTELGDYATITKYSGDLRDSLNAAWGSAILAKEKIHPKVPIGTDENSGALWIDITRQGRARFTDAFHSAIIVSGQLSSILAEDRQTFDTIGADQTYPSDAHSQYLKNKELLDALHEIFYGGNISTHGYDYCHETDNVSIVRCLGSKLSDYRNDNSGKYITGTDAVELYNLILSPFKEEKSALTILTGMHEANQKAIEDFKYLYQKKLAYYDNLAEDTQSLFSDLQSQKADLITPEMESQTPVPTSDILPGSLSTSIDGIGKRLEDRGRMDAVSLFSSKRQDYIYLAIAALDNATLRMSFANSELKILTDRLSDLYNAADKKARDMLDKRSTSLLYITAADLYGESAGLKTKGEKIAKLSKAINYLSYVENGKDKYDFSYADMLASSLSNASCNVNAEKSAISRYKQTDDPKFYDDTVLAVGKIIDDMKYGCRAVINSVSQLRDQASSYISAADLLESNGFDVDAKLGQYKTDFAASLTKDAYLSTSELKDAYSRIVAALEPKVKVQALKYIAMSAVFKCSAQGMIFEARNIFDFHIRDIKINGTTISRMNPSQSITGPINKTCVDSQVPQDYLTNKQAIDEKEGLVNSICNFQNCADIRKMLKTASTDLQNNRTVDLTNLSSAIEDASYLILGRFNYGNLTQRLQGIKDLKSRLSIAVDANVDFDASDYITIYSQKKFNSSTKDIDKLAKIILYFDTVSFSSQKSSDMFKELTAKFSKTDLANMNSEIDAVENQLQKDLDYAKQTSAAKIERTGKEMTSGNTQMQDSLNLALKSYENGEYNKAALYADKAHDQASTGPGFPMDYLVVGVMISGVALYVLKRTPQKETKKKTRFEEI